MHCARDDAGVSGGGGLGGVSGGDEGRGTMGEGGGATGEGAGTVGGVGGESGGGERGGWHMPQLHGQLCRQAAAWHFPCAAQMHVSASRQPKMGGGTAVGGSIAGGGAGEGGTEGGGEAGAIGVLMLAGGVSKRAGA